MGHLPSGLSAPSLPVVLFSLLSCLSVPRASDRDGLLSHGLKVTASPPSPPAEAPPVATSHDGRRWWAEKKTGTISTRRNKKRGFKARTQNISREWVLKSFTPGHGGVWLRVESRGGNEGSIYHYRLIPSSLAQPDIPPSFDINHDFSIIDPLCSTEGRTPAFLSIPVPPPCSIPLFCSLRWRLIIIKHYWFEACWMSGKACFYGT